MGTLLKIGDKEIQEPAAEDIAAALQGPRDDDWYHAARGEEDYMDVMIDAGELWVECGRVARFSRPGRMDEAGEEMLLAFRDGGAGATCRVAEPEIREAERAAEVAGRDRGRRRRRSGWWSPRSSPQRRMVEAAPGALGVIAVAALVKWRSRSAASWKKGSARIVRL
jgi:hypothetical protein